MFSAWIKQTEYKKQAKFQTFTSFHSQRLNINEKILPASPTIHFVLNEESLIKWYFVLATRRTNINCFKRVRSPQRRHETQRRGTTHEQVHTESCSGQLSNKQTKDDCSNISQHGKKEKHNLKKNKQTDCTYLRRSFSTMSNMLFNWQNNSTRCWDTTGSERRSVEPGDEEPTPIPQSISSCLYINLQTERGN